MSSTSTKKPTKKQAAAAALVNAIDYKKIIEPSLQRLLKYEAEWKAESAKGVDLLLQLSNTSIEKQYVTVHLCE